MTTSADQPRVKMAPSAPRGARRRLDHLARALSPAAPSTPPLSAPAAAAAPLPPGCVPVPAATSDAAEAYELLQRDGAVLLNDCFDAALPLTQEEIIATAASLPPAVFGSHLRFALPPAAKILGRDSGRQRPGDLGMVPNSPHQDNAWGPFSMDYLLLLCDKPADSGGESYLVDGLAIIEALSPEDRAAWGRVRFGPHHYQPKEHAGATPLMWDQPAVTVEGGRQRLSVGTGGGYETSQWQEWPTMEQPPEDQVRHAHMFPTRPPRLQLGLTARRGGRLWPRG